MRDPGCISQDTVELATNRRQHDGDALHEKGFARQLNQPMSNNTYSCQITQHGF